jgi:glucan phosphoethanolaminetransferase (alkaline phosphatase superfamily)
MITWLRSALRAEAREWDVSERLATRLFVWPIVAAFLVALTAVYRPLYGLFVDEDRLVEWAQFFALAALVVLGFAIGLRLARLRQRTFAALFIIAAVGALFIAGEEISWGQRMLGWATPTDLADINKQGETNIHNIGNVLQFMNLVMFAVAVVAGVLPFVWRWGAGDRERDLGQILLVPPLFLASSFLAAASYRLMRYALVPDARYVINHLGEIAEMLLYGAFVVFAWLVYRRLGRLSVTS